MKTYISHNGIRETHALKFANIMHADSLRAAEERTDERMRYLKQVAEFAEDGRIAVIESGRDCDGVQYDGHVSVVDATRAAIEAHIDYSLRYADGPMYFRLERPSVARGVERTSRDLTMEAFEDGHAHCLHG